MTGLQDVRVLVVGGASGIGQATARSAVELGARVVVLDRDEPAEALLGDGDLTHLPCDATNPVALERAVAGAVDHLGGLDALVHTVGVHDSFRPIDEYDLGSLASVSEVLWRINITSGLLSVRAALPALRDSEVASVTLTSSESGFGARGGGPLYAASKWAVRGLVDHLSAELAPGIRVNGVAPGGTSGTRLRGIGNGSVQIGERPGREDDLLATTKLRCRIDAADVATAYTYLVSPTLARAVTGAIINVDGGRNTI